MTALLQLVFKKPDFQIFMDKIAIDSSLRTVEWKDNKVIMIDQTKRTNLCRI